MYGLIPLRPCDYMQVMPLFIEPCQPDRILNDYKYGDEITGGWTGTGRKRPPAMKADRPSVK